MIACSRFAAKSPENRASVSHQELTRSPQILRQRWIIIGEFLVSFVLTHISAIRLSSALKENLAHPTRFERVTFAFGGQRFDTEALECLGAVRPQILPRPILRGGLFSFGNGCQPIGIASAPFQSFFQTRLEIVG